MIPAVSIVDGLLGGVKAMLFQMVFLLGPLFALAAVLHLLERFTSRRLSARLGWWSILWTGWIGTPIHEMSHALFCPLFGHRIKEIALFKPDRATGCLGYVNHTYNTRNPWHVIGNFFIGAAPLFGGAAVMFLILFIFYPGAAKTILKDGGIADGMATGNLVKMVGAFFTFSVHSFETLWKAVSFGQWQFYLFLYLIICVGSHLAPSPQDMKGMGKGFLVFAILILIINIIVSFLGGFSASAFVGVARIVGPVVALFALAAVLNTVVAAVVFSVTEVTGLVWGGSQGKKQGK